MTSTHNFDWIASSKEAIANELFGRNFLRTSRANVRGLCGICGREATKGERIYFSNAQSGKFASRWGHDDCVKRVRQQTIAVEAGVKTRKAEEMRVAVPPTTVPARSVEIRLAELEGWQAGVREVFLAMMGLTQGLAESRPCSED